MGNSNDKPLTITKLEEVDSKSRASFNLFIFTRTSKLLSSHNWGTDLIIHEYKNDKFTYIGEIPNVHPEFIWSAYETEEDGIVLTCGDNSIINIIDIENKKIIDKFDSGHKKWVRKVLQTKDNSRIITSSDDSTIKIFNKENYENICTVFLHKNSVYNILELKNDELVSLSGDKTVKFFDLNLYRIYDDYTIKGVDTYEYNYNALTYLEDKDQLLISCQNSKILVIDLLKHKIIHEITNGLGNGSVYVVHRLLNNEFVVGVGMRGNLFLSYGANGEFQGKIEEGEHRRGYVTHIICLENNIMVVARYDGTITSYKY